MFGTRQTPVPGRVRSLLALSTLALVAFCCVPVLAQADSSGIQYQDAPPTVPGKTATSGNNGSATSSKDGDGGSATGSGAADGGSSAGGSSSKSGGAGGAGEDRAQGSPGSRSDEGKGSGAGSAESGAPPQATPQPVSSEDDGSSPLVPILIAIAVLAAISIAVVVMRQRRQRDSAGSPVSPEAS